MPGDSGTRFATDCATQLLMAMTALPVGHPQRALLRARAIEAWLPMARRLASRYSGRGEPLGDLVQSAAIGLIRAVDNFDPLRGVDFVGYALPTVLGEIKRHFRDHTWAVRVPRRLQELRLAITAANNELTQTLSRLPTVADIAAHLRITEEQVLEGLEGARAYHAMPLSTPVGTNSRGQLDDLLGGDDHGYELAETRIALAPALARLDQRERMILTLRFYGNRSQVQIAGQLGISQMHVSRLLARALLTLRHQFEAEIL
ncbi:SigB/SigF/SigG family RNA polymerase sigma factor [Winogradskya humida]|uniref:RNA polymerase sigma-B factor n=1 Tax=Winogradskya humida TaxID=113566 RepID=A0ABQ4A5N2_9ACTN|nr:SigB/SigF/SigG family RNA polymerase sigma factor [Actinoplanes humidus]GIE26034.1 hypothetical protein Ahu01nite_091360 [Actinoplanes humidus]